MANSIEIDLGMQKWYNLFTKGWGKQHLIGGKKMNAVTRVPNLVLIGEIFHTDFYDPSGRRIRISLKTRDRKTAIERLIKIRNEAFNEGFFESRKPVKKTFSELAEEVLKYAKNYTKRYDKVYLPAFNGLNECFGKKYLHEITSDSIMQYHIARKDKVSVGSANSALKVIRKAFNFAKQNGYSKVNPADKVPFFKEPERVRRSLSKEEVLKFLKCCDQQLKDIVLLALLTGMRKGEIRNLKWEHVDFINRRLILVNTKSGKIRRVPISSRLYKMLKAREEVKTSKFVFASRDGSAYYDFRMFDKAVKSAGIEKFRFHDMRHTFATLMIGEDVSTSQINLQQLLGHAKFETTMIYVNQDEKAKRDGVERLDRYLFGDEEDDNPKAVSSV